MKCIFCDNEFEQKQTGRTPKFCSAKCRVYFNRGANGVSKENETVEPIPVRDINRVTGEVYEDKASKLDSLREMMESVNKKYEAPLEPKERVESQPEEVYVESDYPVPPPPIPYIPRPKTGVIIPAKREVYFDEGDKVELVYEDNPL